MKRTSSPMFPIIVASMTALLPSAWAQPAAMHQRVCLNPAETREAMVSQRLADPFRAMRNGGALMRAEPVGEKLCRWSDQFVYEITLLRHDGRVIHLFVDATTGKVMGSNNDR